MMTCIVIQRADGRYLTGYMSAAGVEARWTENPYLAYTYELHAADAMARSLRACGQLVEVATISLRSIVR